MKRKPRRWVRLAVHVALVAALAAASYPAWRVLTLDEEPTLEELQSLRCATR